MLKKHEIPAFTIHAGISCLYSCISNVLHYFNITYDESEIFFLSEGLELTYIQGTTIETNKMLFPSPRKMVHQICKNTNIQYQYCVNNCSDFIDIIYSIIQQDYPVVVAVPPKEIPDYANYFADLNVENEFHFLICYGYDDEHKFLKFADPYYVNCDGVITPHKSIMSIEWVLKNALEAFWIIPNQDTLKIKSVNTALTAKKALTKFITPLKTNATKVNIHAIDCYIKDLNELKDVSEDVFEKSLFELGYLIKTHFVILFDYLIQFLLLKKMSISMLKKLKLLRKNWDMFYIQCLKTGLMKNIAKLNLLSENGLNLLYQTRTTIDSYLELL